MNDDRRFYGKYRGVVADNRDPDGLGRIRARVPGIYGREPGGWALPCVPYAGPGVGLHLIPPEEAWVWIEFENGDPDYPIWSGCFWTQADDLPVEAASGSSSDKAHPELKVLKTEAGTITLNGTEGESGIIIETQDFRIQIDASEISIDAGQGNVKINGAQVSINNGALEVT